MTNTQPRTDEQTQKITDHVAYLLDGFDNISHLETATISHTRCFAQLHNIPITDAEIKQCIKDYDAALPVIRPSNTKPGDTFTNGRQEIVASYHDHSAVVFTNGYALSYSELNTRWTKVV